MGSGHVVIAFYEIVPVGIETEIIQKDYDDVLALRYNGTNHSNEYASVSIRYKDPNSETSKLIETFVETSAFKKYKF